MSQILPDILENAYQIDDETTDKYLIYNKICKARAAFSAEKAARLLSISIQ